jgi:GMP synthase-like glutamine amidotransferase
MIAYIDCLLPPFKEIFWRGIRRQLGANVVQVPVGPDSSLELDSGWTSFIISGSQYSPTQCWVDMLRPVLDSDLPGLGICFGHEIMAAHLGAALVEETEKLIEIAPATWSVDGQSYRSDLFFSHRFHVRRCPEHFVATRGRDGNVAMLQDRERGRIGVQWHPEVDGQMFDEISFHWTGLLSTTPVVPGRLLKDLHRAAICGSQAKYQT